MSYKKHYEKLSDKSDNIRYMKSYGIDVDLDTRLDYSAVAMCLDLMERVAELERKMELLEPLGG
jgi:hypothetical protein